VCQGKLALTSWTIQPEDVETESISIKLRPTSGLAQSFEGANLNGADLEEADLRGADLRNVDLSTVRSFYKASLAAEILSEIRAKWPEKTCNN